MPEKPVSKVNARKSFVGGVAALTLSTAAVKFIGMFYKIPMIYLVGVEGMAYFLAAYHIYALLFTLSTAGLPVAVSILISRSRASGNTSEIETIFKISLILFAAVGAVCTGILLFGAESIAFLIDIEEAAPGIRAVAPSLFFISLGSAIKGYFQGFGNMRPTAVSQIIESLGKLVLGILFTKIAIDRGMSLPNVAAAAISGLTAGVILSTAYLFFRKARTEIKADAFIKKREDSRKILKNLIFMAAPITFGAAVINITSLIDTALIASRLKDAGFESSVANSMYSSYGNLSIPIFNLIPAFVSPIAVALAPLIAEAAQKGDSARAKKLTETSFKLCGLVSIPSAFGIAIFGDEILSFVFRNQSSAVKLASPLLTVLAPAVFFSCLITLTNAALQSHGKASKPIVSMAVGAAVKIVAEFILVGNPKINILGAPLSTLICDMTIVLLNLHFIRKYTAGSDSAFGLFVRPLISSLGASFTAVIASVGLARFRVGGDLTIFTVVAVDVLIYVILAAKTRSVTDKEIEMLPKGRSISMMLKKIKLLK